MYEKFYGQEKNTFFSTTLKAFIHLPSKRENTYPKNIIFTIFYCKQGRVSPGGLMWEHFEASKRFSLRVGKVFTYPKYLYCIDWGYTTFIVDIFNGYQLYIISQASAFSFHTKVFFTSFSKLCYTLHYITLVSRTILSLVFVHSMYQVFPLSNFALNWYLHGRWTSSFKHIAW